MVSQSISSHEGHIVLDVILQLLSSLTLSTNDAHNLIQVIVDSTDLGKSDLSMSSATAFPTTQTQLSSSSPSLAITSRTMQALLPIPSATPTPPSAPPAVKTLPSATPALLPTPSTTPTLPYATPAMKLLPTPPPQITQWLPDLPMTCITVNGEERFQHHYEGFSFDVPHKEAGGPFYLVTRGRRVGVFSTWTCTSPHVLGGVHCTNLQHHSVCYLQLSLYEAQLSRTMRTMRAPFPRFAMYICVCVPALDRPIAPAFQKHPSTVHQAL
ncbi:uncharacterized protein HD556DRAFT_1437881 [Suillus plorans]|uniref:Uncharacterized protein n=1 Tax=Suillus plorans TaxID=116603 RepID=A0A9P7DTU7_9AGAM|nr:uncharacterized protein HD556DRAFT_1437881 [Suillus plorans]KAG1802816.1 hypothetical protein HD556DRAFT_1437881 [Suillus plorans]